MNSIVKRLRNIWQVSRSLPGRMTITVLLFTISFGTLLMVSVLYLAAQTYQDQFVDSVRGRAFSLGEIAAQEPASARIEKLFQGILLSRRVVYAEFVPSVGNEPKMAPIKMRANEKLRFEEDFFFDDHGDSVYYIAAPVMGKNDLHLGELRLGFDENLTTAQIDHLIQRSLVFALVYLWALLLASIALAQRMSNPIRRLQKASRNIASGHLEQELNVTTKIVEIAELALDLEHMRQELVARNHKLEASEARYSAILQHAAGAIITLDQNARIEGFNMAAELLFGFRYAEIAGCPFSHLVDGADIGTNATAADWATLCADTTFSGRRKDGSTFLLSLTARSFNSGDASLVALVAHDISDRVAYEQEMNGLAFFDTLTQLPNRRLFNDRLRQALDHARRNQQMLAVLFLDLDGFKTVNDTYGHQAGDLLLVAVANRLSALLRSSDTLARLGGDEFTMILTDVKHDLAIRSIAQKIISAFASPFDIEGYEAMSISTSIGITICPNDDSGLETIIEHADTAMYFAKKGGKNNYRIYAEEMSADSAAAEYGQSR